MHCSRLEVTLYNTQGNKINIINPDEGAFDTVDPLCPLPVFYSNIYGLVVYATENSVFIQPSQYVDTVAQLLDQLYEFYNESIHENSVKPEVNGIYAVLSGDSNWYRGQVMAVGEEKATVTYVDYGNSEIVPVTDLRELAAQFWMLHLLALEVSIIFIR